MVDHARTPTYNTHMSTTCGNKGLGMNWIRQEKRLAIYLRDGLACVYCGASAEQGTQLTLDHLKCRCNGGNNHQSNLVTACHHCNSVRSDRSLRKFVEHVAAYVNHGVTAVSIMAHIHTCVARPIDKAGAKAMVAKRGSAAKVLAQYGI